MSLGQDIGSMLIQILFSFYIFFVMLRFLLAWTRADFYNPLSQAVVSITNPTLVPLRRIIPPIGRIDTAAIILMVVLQAIEIWLLTWIANIRVGALAIAIASVFNLVTLAIYVFIGAIFIQVIISWISPGVHNPLASLAHSLTDPLLRPLRRIIPPAGMLDLTPMVALLLLFIALRVLSHLTL